MGILNKIRGGSGSNHHSGRMDYPYPGDGKPKSAAPDPFTGPSSPKPSTPAAPASTPAPSSMRYPVHEGGGDYLHVTSTGDDKHTVSRYGNDHSLKGSVEGAYFGHDSKTGMASWQSSSDPKGYFGTGNVKVTGAYDTKNG